MEHWWNDTDNRERQKYLGKNIPVPLFPPQIFFGFAWA